MSDPLVIAGREFKSRLFLGTAGYPNRQMMLDALAASGSEMATASIRRISLAGDDESLVDLIPKNIHFLPNTAGCQTAKDATHCRVCARALDTNRIKVEVIGDRELLYPDTEELIRATGRWYRRASSCCPIAPRIRSCAASWPTPAPPLSCRSAPRSAPGSASATRI